jgi:hypothetical protein
VSVAIGPEPDETPALSGVMTVRPDAPGGDGPRRPRRWRGLLAVGVVAGVMLATVAGIAALRPWQPAAPACPPIANPDWSIARRWDEALLNSIRRAIPNPPVHARNLFHLSVATWDAWAAYDDTAQGYVVTEKHQAGDVAAARNEAMSYAAYRLLTSRYIAAVGGDVSLSEFADLMDSLCYSLDVTTSEGDTPAAVGNRIADAVLAAAAADGSNEYGGYAATDYAPVNAPMIVADPGTAMADPNRWQPLKIANLVSQNGIPVANGLQEALGPHWGHVTGFALPPGGDAGTPIDPGPPPLLGDPATDAALKAQVLEVIRLNSQLDPGDGATIDISPGAKGANPLGTNDGTGHALNPATGEPYPPVVVAQGDYGRVMAEFWADGPSSETPPGHWNVIANSVSDALAPDLRLGGAGPELDRLEWDTKLYLALNGAVHDAAIAAWGLKGHYDSARPISLIRYMGGKGQSTDPAQPAYDPEGLPLEAGLVEVITSASTAPGERHAALKGHEGEIAVRAWQAYPENPKADTAGVGWRLATEWVPYQMKTFVTPAFPGYVSGHSTFSRAAAEVVAAMTGSEFFPGGESGHTAKAGSLKFESGPTTDVPLKWATYFDAADEAGRSRLWGGIHIAADDLTGREIGSTVGIDAWNAARRYFDGTAGS